LEEKDSLKIVYLPKDSPQFNAVEGCWRYGKYDLGIKTKTSQKLSPSELAKLYRDLIEKYPIILIEDPFAEDDWESWTSFLKTAKIEIVGDDLTVTNTERIKIAHEKRACNSLLLKINQIGTISQAIEAANLAFSYGWGVFVSHRSGETTDDFIADLTVGLRAGHLKTGAPARGERVAKYNRLMDIEDELKLSGKAYAYAGADFRKIQDSRQEFKVPFNVFGH